MPRTARTSAGEDRHHVIHRDAVAEIAHNPVDHSVSVRVEAEAGLRTSMRVFSHRLMSNLFAWHFGHAATATSAGRCKWLLAAHDRRHGGGLGQASWIFERRISWMKGPRRMRVRYDRLLDVRMAWATLAVSVICYRLSHDESSAAVEDLSAAISGNQIRAESSRLRTHHANGSNGPKSSLAKSS